MAVYPGIAVVTLAVENVARARAFYEALGWRAAAAAGDDDTALFALNNIALALAPARAGAARVDGRVRFGQRYGGGRAVDRAMRRVVAAGGAVLERPSTTAGGFYRGVFADPDGHVWELVFDPRRPPAADGALGAPS